MSRGRVIKPEFWTDEKVIALTPWARLFYIGLWNFTYCDRGHLPDSSFELKLKILPADQVDHREIVDELIQQGKLTRVQAGRETFLQMPSFERHQTVDKRWKNPRCPACAQLFPANLAQPPRSSDEPGGAQPNSAQRGEERREEEMSAGGTPSTDVAIATPPSEVDYILDYLDECLTRNGVKKPTRSKGNLDAARLLLERDGKTVPQVLAAINWATSDEFWRVNILSMRKLREKYDQLQLAATREQNRGSGKGKSKTAANLQLVERLREQERTA